MRNIKLIAGSGFASLALMLGVAVAPVAAQSANANGPGNDTATSTQTTNVDRSVNVNGNCSGVIYSSVDQNQQTLAGNLGGNLGGNGGGQTTDQSTTQSNTVTNSQTAGVTFNPDCSVNNVTTVAAASTTSTQAQVKAPVGGVEAGLGGGATAGSSLQAIFGLVGSLSTAGLGMGLKFFKKEL